MFFLECPRTKKTISINLITVKDNTKTTSALDEDQLDYCTEVIDFLMICLFNSKNTKYFSAIKIRKFPIGALNKSKISYEEIKKMTKLETKIGWDFTIVKMMLEKKDQRFILSLLVSDDITKNRNCYLVLLEYDENWDKFIIYKKISLMGKYVKNFCITKRGYLFYAYDYFDSTFFFSNFSEEFISLPINPKYRSEKITNLICLNKSSTALIMRQGVHELNILDDLGFLRPLVPSETVVTPFYDFNSNANFEIFTKGDYEFDITKMVRSYFPNKIEVIRYKIAPFSLFVSPKEPGKYKVVGKNYYSGIKSILVENINPILLKKGKLKISLKKFLSKKLICLAGYIENKSSVEAITIEHNPFIGLNARIKQDFSKTLTLRKVYEYLKFKNGKIFLIDDNSIIVNRIVYENKLDPLEIEKKINLEDEDFSEDLLGVFESLITGKFYYVMFETSLRIHIKNLTNKREFSKIFINFKLSTFRI